jgi:hypothetical protein
MEFMETSCEDGGRMKLAKDHFQWCALILVILKIQSPLLHKSDSVTSHPRVTLTLQSDTAYIVHTLSSAQMCIHTCWAPHIARGTDLSSGHMDGVLSSFLSPLDLTQFNIVVSCWNMTCSTTKTHKSIHILIQLLPIINNQKKIKLIRT